MKNNNQQGNQQGNQSNNQQANQSNNQQANQSNNQQGNQSNNQMNVSNSLSALDALTKQLDFEASTRNNNSVPNTKLKNAKAQNTKPVNTKPVNTKASNTKPLNTKPVNAKPVKPTKPIKTANIKVSNGKVSTTKKSVVKKSDKKINRSDAMPNHLYDIDINDLDEQIKKLEQELKINKNKKYTCGIDNKNDLEKPEIVVDKEQNSGLSENEINESKKALIKLFLEAKKNKKSNDLTSNTISSTTENDDVDTTYNMNNTNNIDDTDNIRDKINLTNSYEENFDIEGFDQTYTNEEEIMKIDFNDPESKKLIKVIDDEDKNYTVPLNVKIRSSNPNNSFAISRNNVGNFVKGSVDFEVNSSLITSFDCYNDYMANLPKSVNITDIKIKNIELPKNSRENINKSNNELKIVIDNKEQIFELEENYYNRYEIKDFLNEAFNAYNFDIMCDIQEDNFIFSSNTKFAMINHETSILPTLGFNRNAYVNRNIYSAENCHQIGDNIFYVVIENISEHPLFYINNDSGEINKLQEVEPTQIDHFIIKFYKTQKDLIKNNKDYKFFFDNSHFIAFELVV